MENPIKVLDALREPLNGITVQQEIEVRLALERTHTINSDENLQLARALALLRDVFRKLEDRERRPRIG